MSNDYVSFSDIMPNAKRIFYKLQNTYCYCRVKFLRRATTFGDRGRATKGGGLDDNLCAFYACRDLDRNNNVLRQQSISQEDFLQIAASKFFCGGRRRLGIYRGRATRGGVWDERGRSLDRAFGEGRSNI